jgi:hypothetical protein
VLLCALCACPYRRSQRRNRKHGLGDGRTASHGAFAAAGKVLAANGGVGGGTRYLRNASSTTTKSSSASSPCGSSGPPHRGPVDLIITTIPESQLVEDAGADAAGDAGAGGRGVGGRGGGLSARAAGAAAYAGDALGSIDGGDVAWDDYLFSDGTGSSPSETHEGGGTGGGGGGGGSTEPARPRSVLGVQEDMARADRHGLHKFDALTDSSYGTVYRGARPTSLRRQCTYMRQLRLKGPCT